MFELVIWRYRKEAEVQIVPQLLGLFNMPGTKGSMLLTMAGETTEGPLHNDKSLT